MASRPELVMMMKELGLNTKDLTIEQMMEAVRAEADVRWADKDYKVSADVLSNTLKHFLVNEYDFVIKDKYGEIERRNK